MPARAVGSCSVCGKTLATSVTVHNNGDCDITRRCGCGIMTQRVERSGEVGSPVRTSTNSPIALAIATLFIFCFCVLTQLSHQETQLNFHRDVISALSERFEEELRRKACPD